MDELSASLTASTGRNEPLPIRWSNIFKDLDPHAITIFVWSPLLPHLTLPRPQSYSSPKSECPDTMKSASRDPISPYKTLTCPAHGFGDQVQDSAGFLRARRAPTALGEMHRVDFGTSLTCSQGKLAYYRRIDSTFRFHLLFFTACMCFCLLFILSCTVIMCCSLLSAHVGDAAILPLSTTQPAQSPQRKPPRCSSCGEQDLNWLS